MNFFDSSWKKPESKALFLVKTIYSSTQITPFLLLSMVVVAEHWGTEGLYSKKIMSGTRLQCDLRKKKVFSFNLEKLFNSNLTKC